MLQEKKECTGSIRNQRIVAWGVPGIYFLGDFKWNLSGGGGCSLGDEGENAEIPGEVGTADREGR